MNAQKTSLSLALGFFLLLLAALACSIPGSQESPRTEITLRAREIALALTETDLAVQIITPCPKPIPGCGIFDSHA